MLLAENVEVTAIGLSKDEFNDIQDEKLTTVVVTYHLKTV